MAIFAILKDSKVENTIIADEIGVVRLFFPDNTVEEITEATGNAMIGGDFFQGKFRSIKPFDSWSWDAEAADWAAPKAYPTDGKTYVWSEGLGEWEEVILVTEAPAE